jgi:hypothetical protein
VAGGDGDLEPGHWRRPGGIAGGACGGCRWVDGKLSAGGLQALPFEQLVKKAHELGLVTGATVHVFNRWQWTEADFVVNGQAVRIPVDGLSVRMGAGEANGKRTTNGYDVLDRRKVYIAPVQRNNAVTYYSAVGTLVELSVHEASGKVSLLNAPFDHGVRLATSPALVSGQLQGGIAMGIGHALHEFLPLYEDGPGNGTWNFNRYHLPRASDVAVWTQTGTVLPPISDTDPPKGIAEVVMIPVVGAIVNGIAHAIGHRFTDLPVTAEKIRRYWHDRHASIVHEHQRQGRRPARGARRPDDDRFPARVREPDRRLGCGQGVCHACVAILDHPDGTSETIRTCITGAHFFQGKRVRTVEGHGKRNDKGEVVEMTPVQQAFLKHFSFQCGYCTPGSSTVRPCWWKSSSVSR